MAWGGQDAYQRGGTFPDVAFGGDLEWGKGHGCGVRRYGSTAA